MTARHGARDATRAVGTDAVGELTAGGRVPNFELPDHAKRVRCGIPEALWASRNSLGQSESVIET
jgi:hypothetical protein